MKILAPEPIIAPKGGNMTVSTVRNRGGLRGLVLNAGISPGLSSSAAIVTTLTDFAIGHMNDLQDTMTMAERICPTVRVPGSVGRYKKFDDINSFLVYSTSRGIGADPTRIQFAAEDEYYHCAPQALEVTVDEEERNLVGADNALAQQLLDEGKIKALLNACALSYTYNRINYVLANVAATAGVGNFSNPSIDPIDQIELVLDNLVKACGGGRNVMIDMDLGAWRAIRSNPIAKRRIIGVQTQMMTVQQFQDALFMPVDCKVHAISYVAAPGSGPAGGGSATANTPTAGEFTAKLRLMAGTVLVHYSSPNPTIYDPSAFKSFTVGTGNVEAVQSYMAPNGLYGGHLVKWSEDIEQTSSIAMQKITTS